LDKRRDSRRKTVDSGAMEQEKNDFSSRIFGRGGSVSNTTCLKKGPMPKD
jgi:hypothetical protein